MPKKTVAVVEPIILPGGGTEAVTAWIIEALKNTYEVSLITYSRVVADVLNQYYGTSLDDQQYSTVHPWIPSMLVKTNRFSILKDHLMMRYCKSVHKDFDLFISVGGGGLACGIGSALKQLNPDIRVIAVQPAACAPLEASLSVGHPVWVTPEVTLCDGLGVPLVTDEMWPLLHEVISETVTVSEDEVKNAIKRLALDNKLVVEGAGAAALAAALSMPVSQRGRSVCVLSGGSIDGDKLASIIEEVK